jgi:hypothetical protein
MNHKKTEQEIVDEINKMVEENLEKIRKGELTIKQVEERIITPDQKRPHQFGYF